MTAVGAEVELRCEANPLRLLAKIRQPQSGVEIVDGNLIEIACDHCKRVHRQRDPQVLRVLHRWNVLGELIETETVRAES